MSYSSNSRSKKGTFKTTSHINYESKKYVPRSDHGKSKTGHDGSQAAHIFGYGLMNALSTHKAGRPRTSSLKEFHRDMNHPTNMRLKSSYGNQVLDERRDARIAKAVGTGDKLYGKSTADRAFQAYQSASSFTTMDSLADQLGNMRVHNPNTGRSYKLKNHSKYT
mmetsp:Transcript_21813/g.30822  ORF Transcript_21813/g.30822 Transcript_21813/m.30822 type:complete len:165 (+) Transcript_21813:111-605(+)